MSRHVFFSFHYQRDIWRASIIRNSSITKQNTAPEFWDDASWESVKRQGDQAIKNWINREMKGTSVTVVLIGTETSDRKYVKYELQRSYQEGKGILGIYINNMKDQHGDTDYRGNNPLDILPTHYETYDWALDKGYQNIGDWIEEAARNAGK